MKDIEGVVYTLLHICIFIYYIYITLAVFSTWKDHVRVFSSSIPHLCNNNNLSLQHVFPLIFACVDYSTHTHHNWTPQLAADLIRNNDLNKEVLLRLYYTREK